MQYDVLLTNVEEYVRELFKDHPNNKLVYHNLAHTEHVVAHTKEIAAHYNLNEEDLFILNVAAWFHDVGHLFTRLEYHEADGIERMKTFFKTKGITESIIKKIAGCIIATRYPPNPRTLLEEIICDADTYNLGTEEFKTTDTLVKKEMELRTGKVFDNWLIKSAFLLSHHNYFTGYCKAKLDAGLKKNLQYMLALIDKNDQGANIN